MKPALGVVEETVEAAAVTAVLVAVAATPAEAEVWGVVAVAAAGAVVAVMVAVAAAAAAAVAAVVVAVAVVAAEAEEVQGGGPQMPQEMQLLEQCLPIAITMCYLCPCLSAESRFACIATA